MGGFIILRLTATCCQYQTSQKLLGIPVSLHPDIELTISIVQRLLENDGGMRGSGLDEGNFQKKSEQKSKTWSVECKFVACKSCPHSASTTIHKTSLATTITATSIYIYIVIYICIHTIHQIVSMAHVYNYLIDIFTICFSISSMLVEPINPLELQNNQFV